MPFYFRIPLSGAFGYRVRTGGARRPAPARRAPAPEVATETEQARLRLELRRAIERADQDAFELAWARLLELTRTKAGGNNLGSIGVSWPFPDEEQRALKGYVAVIRDCVGDPEKLEIAQSAASEYNALAARANRRIDMLMRLGDRSVSDADRLQLIEV